LTGPLEKTNSAYAVSKIAGIELIKAYRKQFNKDWISVMPCNMYGPNDNFDLSSSHVIPALIHKFVRARQMKNSTVKLLGTGNPLREFLFVDDFAKALVLIMKSYSSDVPINVGTGEEITIRNLAQTIAQIVGFEGEISWDDSAPDGTNRKVLDISKIRGFGWSPKYSLIEGLTITVDWFLRNKKVVV
jgi:GDP-L-fucose synthase